MKKLLIVAIMILCAGPSVMAQTTDSAGNENWNYNRIFVGYDPTIFYPERGNTTSTEMFQGFHAGWMGGYNVTGKRLPLYVEPGLKLNVGLGELISDFDKYLAVEVPVNVAYRFHIGNKNIHISPYMGLHFKANVLGRDDDGNDYFDIDGTKRFQFGMQAGGHFDFNRFYVGLGWWMDFLPIMDNGIKTFWYDENVNTLGFFVNVGVVF